MMTCLGIVDSGTMATPLPLPTRFMSPLQARHLVVQNTDFRRAPLFVICLSCPYVLAIATYDRGYILEHVVPAVPELTEGSMWDLTDPDATIVLTRNNGASTLQIDDWIRRQGQGPRRGIEATAVRFPTHTNDHRTTTHTTGTTDFRIGATYLVMGHHHH